MSTDAKSRYAAAGFVALLILSVFWPAPIVSMNRLWLHRDLPVDELSFLGREQPSWDVVFWCVAGLFTTAVVHSGDPVRGRRLQPAVSGLRPGPTQKLSLAVAVGVLAIAAVWFLADSGIVAAAERVQSDSVDDWIRIANRLGGGINPPMIVLFFLIAGIAYRRRTWIGYGVAMALAGLGAGLLAQVIKLIVGRTRPELWLGPFRYIRGAANSFPSGHTVAAFALGGVLIFASRNTPLRITALLLACFVAVARVLAFRHWPSDVVASAFISLLAAWVAQASTSAKFTDTSREQPASSIVTP
jgi:membrane-associated phospholipid phosphatase